jgi:hypothetical protein
MDLNKVEQPPNFIFPLAAELMLTDGFNWMTDEYRLLLLDDRYILPTDLPIYESEIYTALRVAESPVLVNKSATEGNAYATGVEFPDLYNENPITQAMLYRQRDGLLVVYYSESNELPFTAEGGNYFILPNQMCFGWFNIGQRKHEKFLLP